MQTIGVDLGGTNLSAGAVDANGQISGLVHFSTDRTHGAETIGNQIIACCRTVCERVGMASSEVLGVGIAAPGWVDAEKGIVLSSANLPLRRFALAAWVAREIGCPVRVENDANCAALGELVFGAAKGESEVVLITVGTGIGGGVIREGRLMSGPGVAELGHTMLRMGGARCGCGRRGCCEAYTSATALIRMAGEAAQQNPESILNRAEITGETVFEAAKIGDCAAVAVLDEYFSCFAEMLMDFVNIFRPRVILIGGGVADAGNAFFEPLQQAFDRVMGGNAYGADAPTILHAALGNDAGILGAAALFGATEK